MIEEIVTELCWIISRFIYEAIPAVYKVFDFFANFRFFSEDEVSAVWNNLYIILSVLVLFAIGIKLINSIIDPNVLDGGSNGKKKSAKYAFFDAVIAVFLTILIPIMFTALYDIQKNVIDDNLIPQYIFGKKLNTQEGYNTDVGEILAYQTLSSFVYPCSAEFDPEASDNSITCEAAKGESYMNLLSYSMSYMKAIPASDITVYSDIDGKVRPGALVFHGIGGVFGGAIVLYQLILMTLDMALRSVKLGVLEMMVPVVLGAFIFKREILGKWFKEFISTYISIFLRLIVLTILIEAMSKLEFINTFLKGNPDYVGHPLVSGILRLVLIMGILRLIKEIPTLVNKIFGIEIKDQGGIGGRLGQMAGVGGLAQNAWKSLTSHPIQKAGKLVTGAVSAVGGAAAHGVATASRARRLLNSGDERGAILAALGGVFTMGGAAVRGARQGWKYGNIRAIGAQGRRYEDTHKFGSTLGGRLMDDFRETMGLDSREAVYVRNAEKAQKARSALNASYQQAQQLATSEYSNQHYGVRTVLSSSAGRNSQYHNQNLTAYQMSQAITQLRETLSNTTDVDERRRLSADIQQLSADYDRHINTTTRHILNDASNGVNLDAYITNPANIQEREFASSVQNSITENIGTYGANMTMEQGTGVRNLVGITGGNLGTNFDALITGADTTLTELTQQYRPDGTITARGRANADQRSRDNRYVDNAKPPHGGGNS